MHHQQQHNAGVTEDGADLEMPEALAQALAQAQVQEELLEDHQAGEGAQLLVLETQRRQSMSSLAHLGSAKLHRERSCCWVMWRFARHILPQRQAAPPYFFLLENCFFIVFLDLTDGEVQKQAASIDSCLELQAQTHFPAEIYATGR
jgi:hypothetical protein